MDRWMDGRMMTSQGQDLGQRRRSFEFMPAVSASSPSRGERCADSFVIPCLLDVSFPR